MPSAERSVFLLFLTRILRLFAFGLISVFLVLYLTSLGFSAGEVGLLLSLTLIGDTLISLWITVNTDRIGRRRMLILGALLMAGAGVVFALTDNYWLLLVAAAIGVISPSGNEVGPFLAIEQASVSQLVHEENRTSRRGLGFRISLAPDQLPVAYRTLRWHWRLASPPLPGPGP